MQNNDISNAMPRRVLVTLDVLIDEYRDTKKVLGVIPVTTTKTEYNRLVLSHLYMYTVNSGVTLELISFTHSEKEMVELLLHLDRLGTNPFRYGSIYKSVDRLVHELPMRPEVIGVLDIPSRQLRYGRWGMDFPSL